MKYFKTKILSYVLIGLFIAGFFAFGVNSAVAQSADSFGLKQVGDTVALGGGDIRVTIARIIRTILGLLGVIAVAIVLYGGFTYMTSSGDEEKIGRAKKILVNGVIGLAITLSSFAIAQFVLNSLSKATGTGVIDEAVTCADTEYASLNPVECLQDPTSFCNRFPGFCTSSDFFYVKSITPSTPGGATGMNNIAIRVIFSKPLASGINADDVLTLEYNGQQQPISAEFSATRQVVEVVHSLSTPLCEDVLPAGVTCLNLGNFTAKVDPNLKDTTGRELTATVDGQNYPLSANFSVDRENIDRVRPSINSITVDGSNANEQNLLIGEAHTLQVSVSDDSGVGLVHIKVQNRISGRIIVDSYEGPSVASGSTGEYVLSYPIILGADIDSLSRFRIEVTANDIDHNTELKVLDFTALAGHCNNGIQDGDETDVDSGGSCSLPEGSYCTEDWQCSSKKCLNNQCVAWPMILDVSPMSGGEGSFVTIVGQFFGNTQGTVEFGYDSNGNGIIENNDTWIKAETVACQDFATWKDDYIIVYVPNDSALTIGSKSAIKVTKGDGSNLFDTSIDSHGPNPGTDRGLFTKDQTTRPGLCSVKTSSGSSIAKPNIEIFAAGENFGSEQAGSSLVLGTVETSVSSWGNNDITSRIPLNMNSGKTLAQVEVGGVKSNSVPFVVLPTDEDFLPVIESVDPQSTTAGSFVTINGTGFGNSTGIVYLSTIAGATCVDVEAENCVKASAILPDFCGDTWSSNQVIVQIPEGFSPGSYYIVLYNSAGFATNGQDTMSIVAGGALPGICKLVPSKGPAPLPAGHSGLEFYGINFSNNPTVYFWYKNSNPNDINTWLRTSGAEIKQITPGSHLSSIIPSTVDGYSMQTGPIRIQSSNGELSNAINYEVLDCRNSITPAGFQCCSEGPDAGLLKPKDFICAGEVRDAGYVWRFTSSFLPKVPYVIEQCPDPNDPGVPSPSPWVENKQGRRACLNATPTVLFSMGMDRDTLAQNIKVKTCGNEDSSDCENEDVAQDVTNNFNFNLLDSGKILSLSNSNDLLPNTWYRVELGENIQSQEVVSILGVEQTVNEKLLISKPCGTGTAYCFEFKTGEGLCTLLSAHVAPDSYTTRNLGPVLDSRYPRSNEVPLYYNLYGRGNQECTVLNVDGYGWNWKSEDVSKARVELSVDSSHTDSQAVVEAFDNTSPDDVKIFATSPNTTLAPESSLVVDLADPQVISFWPNCSASCVNSGLGVEFNRKMNIEDFSSGFKLSECADEFCENRFDLGIATQVIDSTEYVLQAYPVNNFKPNTWYYVEILPTIRAIESEDPLRLGKTIAAFSWKFRTKNDSSLCGIETVLVDPDDFSAHLVGEKKGYKVIPLSSPNECSLRGQRLNPWDFGWTWKTTDEKVVNISNFESKGETKPYCSDTCLPLGSSILYNENTPSLCGNGVVESGEDCDIAISGEIVGVSCGLNCLRPGSLAPICGNGVVEPEKGEECDVANPDSGIYCSDKCLWIGSSKREPQPQEIGVSWCGSGSVTLGEDCDIKDPATQEGCSNTCLNIGSSVSSAWCNANSDRSLPNDGGRLIKNTTECLAAISVCGNSLLENGEQCEIKTIDSVDIFGVGTVSGVSAREICSDSCLLRNICDLTTLPTNLRCDKNNQEGCRVDCTFAGSSIDYTESSLCGDGLVGTGENSICEISSSAVSFGQNPTQITTAVGYGSVDPNTNSQKAQISAQAVKAKDANNVIVDISSPVGYGDYELMCGYTEFGVVKNGRFNDCPNASDGVGNNSCCYPRPQRSDEYPKDGTGIGNATEPVCLNTYVEVSFEGNIDRNSISNNILIAKGYPTGYDCTSSQELDITSEVSGLLAAKDINDTNVWSKMWRAVKKFFVKLIGLNAVASRYNVNDISVWCAGSTKFSNNIIFTSSTDPVTLQDEISTTIAIRLNNLLDKDTVYAVVLSGGIKNINGVGIISPDNLNGTLSDSWVFKTGNEVCKIKDVVVRPDKNLYITPNTTSTFQALVRSTKNQFIVPVANMYDWEWRWSPVSGPIYNFNTTTEATVEIASTNLEGKVLEGANAIITADLTGTGGQGESIFTGTTELQSMFCENPWPARNVFPYEEGISFGSIINNDGVDINGNWDGSSIPKVRIGGSEEYFNFSMGYCADDGVSGNKTDDLPYLKPLIINNEFDLTPTGLVPVGDKSLSADTLKKFFFFNDRNDDVVGVQIFMNPKRLTARDWYIEKFGQVSGMDVVSIDGYEALTDGNSYYVNALNKGSNGDIFNNIYLLSINPNAKNNTREVFDKLISSLEFNINISNFGVCSEAGDIDKPNVQEPTALCSTDFDCLNVVTSANVCANAQDKLKRDWQRLADLSEIQEKLEVYSLENNSYPRVAAGSFIPNYTASKWSSWGAFGNLIGGASQDPVNKWSSCGYCSGNTDTNGNLVYKFCSNDSQCGGVGPCEILDEQSCWATDLSQYVCSEKASIYEYEFNNSTNNYVLHTPLEYLNLDSKVVKEFLDTSKISLDRWCSPMTANSASAGICGDGIVNKATGEECDTPKVEYSNLGQTLIPGQSGTCAISNPNKNPLSCNSAADCGSNLKGSRSIYSETGSVCVLDGTNNNYFRNLGIDRKIGKTALIYNRFFYRPMVMKSCNVDADCRDTSQIFSSLGSFPAVLDFENNFQFYFTNKIAESDSTYPENLRCVSLNKIEEAMNQTINYASYSLESVACLGSTEPTLQTMQCSAGLVAETTCTNNCKIDYGVCSALTTCGNGVVEQSESCDDGAQNGTYGNCNSTCSGLFSAYCGDGVVSKPDEICDIKSGGVQVGYCSLQKDTTCSTDTDCNRKELLSSGECKKTSSDTIASNGTCENDSTKTCKLSSNIPAMGRSLDCNVYKDNGICVATNDPTYSYKKENTCSWDCAQFGAYCGDNVVQGSYEQCDDGNNNNNDGCDSFCNNEAGFTQGVSLSNTPRCGDSIVQNGENNTPNLGEVCDLGGQNGVKCNPLYDQSCSYCSLDCRNILTVDPVAYCGNDKIDLVSGAVFQQFDTRKYEICDINTQGQVIDTNSKVQNCPDKGSFSCNAECSTLSNTCVSCVLDESAQPKFAVPKLAVLNPMIGNKDSSVWGISNGVGDPVEYVALYRLNGPAGQLPWFGFTQLNYEQARDSRGNLSVVNKDPTKQNYLLVDNLYVPRTNATIESNNLCSGEYSLYFSHRGISNALGNTTFNSQTIDDGIVNSSVYGDLFNYPVDGTAEINNEVIYSPAVPQDVFRIVVRWTDKEDNQGVLFNGNFFIKPRTGNPVLPLNLTKAGADKKVCDSISLIRVEDLRITGRSSSVNLKSGQSYWWPRLDCSYYNQVYIHPFGEMKNNFTQAITADLFGVQNTYSFVVNAVNSSSTTAPIALFKNSELVVDVYTYHSGQVPQLSVYKPTYTFKIKTAASTSSNPLAKYWHVFNLVNVRGIDGKFIYQVQPVQGSSSGSIETDWSDVLNNI